MMRRRVITAEEKALNAARRVEQAKTTSHCQICDRLIQAKTGLIAHHGYTRPDRGSGWQTASCMGARYRPYEVACDALPKAIKSVEVHIANTKKNLANWKAEPPRGIHQERRVARGFNSYDIEWTVLRPAKPDFDPHRYRTGDEYEALYLKRLAAFERDLKGSGETLKYFKKRLADWRPAAE